MKVKASELVVNDLVSFTTKGIPNYSSPTSLSGIIRTISNQNIKGIIYRYVAIITDTGTKGTYLALTEEVTKTILSEEERYLIINQQALRNLPRVITQQGSDPEIFIVDKDNVVIPSFLFLKSNKDPNRIPESEQPIFWDGFQAEFNVLAQSCLDSTVSHTFYGLRELNSLAKKHDKNARLTIIPTMDIPPHMLVDNKDEHVQFGCMPSKNVYGIKGKIADGREVPFRSAGGHIHLELSFNQKKKIEQYVKALDAILGVACVSMFGAYDDSRRREYYGLAGEYRTPSHGMEYRPLSNVWMCHPTAMYIVYDLARKVISLVDQGLFHLWKYDEAEVIDCINQCNIPLACEILKINEKMFKDILHSICYQRKDTVDVVYNTFMLGIEELIPEVDNVENNWRLLKNCETGYDRIEQIETRHKANYKKLLAIKF